MNSKVGRNLAAACIATLLAGVYGPVAAAQEEQPRDEAALIAVLQGDAGFVEKQEACRALRQIGTAASVPALAALLDDEGGLSHTARYALEEMRYPEVDQALRDALGRTGGAIQAGLAISLGARRDAQAVPLLEPLLKSADAHVANAAAGALGRIATAPAVDALRNARNDAPDALKPALAEALLAAAERMAQDGARGEAEAVYRELRDPAWPMYVRMGAFAGYVEVRPEHASEDLLAALGGGTPEFRDMAAQKVAASTGSILPYVQAMPSLPAEGQVALLRGLADRGDAAARPAVAQAAQSADRNVKLAAVKALGVLGTAEDVPALLAMLASDDAEVAEAARAGLVAMKGDDVNPAIVAAVAPAPADTRAQLIELLAARGAEQTGSVAAQNLSDADKAVRLAALRVLGMFGGEEVIPDVLRTLTQSADASERSAAGRALTEICAADADKTLPMVLNAMNGATPEARVALLSVAQRVGGPQALEAVLAATKDPDPQIAGEAVKLLADWPTLDAAPHLLAFAQGEDPALHNSGLGGYVRLADGIRDAQQKADMLNQAMGLARRPEEKKLVLGAWSSMRHEMAFAALKPYLDDPEVQNEAAAAMIAVAERLGREDATKAAAADALKAVVEKAQDPAIRERAEKTLAAIQ